jgi:hypothetical protein
LFEGFTHYASRIQNLEPRYFAQGAAVIKTELLLNYMQKPNTQKGDYTVATGTVLSAHIMRSRSGNSIGLINGNLNSNNFSKIN